MSVIAAMWSQSMPWRTPNQNPAINTPSPNPSMELAATTSSQALPSRRRSTVMLPPSCNSLQLRDHAHRSSPDPSPVGAGTFHRRPTCPSEPRRLLVVAEDPAQRLDDLALRAS